MKGLKQVLVVAATCVVAAFSSAVYTSCTKDTCQVTHCQHNGSCSSGVCSCPVGTGGMNCEVAYRERYNASYRGFSNGNSVNPGHGDSDIVLTFNPARDTQNYTTMTLDWTEGSTGFSVQGLDIMLDSNKIFTSGSTFTLKPDQRRNGRKYEGNGTISESTASLFIVETDSVSNTKRRYAFSGFVRQ